MIIITMMMVNGDNENNEDKMRMMIVYFNPAGHFCLLATPPEHWK